MSSIVLLARRPRPRWRRPVAILFVVATMAAGLADMQAPAAATSATISGTAWLDTDRNGVQGPGEPPMADDTIWLFDLDSQTLVATDVTRADGTYAFTGLTVGTTYRVQLSNPDWWARWEHQVPTTTPGLRPVHDLVLEGPTVTDFGWRDIVRSESSTPTTSYVGPSGLRVESFNDAVTAEEIHEVLATGTLGAEAPVTVVTFGLDGGSTTSTSTQQVDGVHTSFRANVHLAWLAWLTEANAETLAHEYGHAWGLYHAYEVQQDPTMAGYLEARGLAGDDRVGTSYVWAPAELLAEDYQQLLGPPAARDGGQMNTQIPRAADVVGLEAYLRDEFTHGGSSPSEAEPEPPSGDEPPMPDTAPPVIDLLSPAHGDQLTSGPLTVETLASDDQTPTDQLHVSVVIDTQQADATLDPATGHFTVTLDGSGLAGSHELEVIATDLEGNVATASAVVEVVHARGGGARGSTKEPVTCRGKKC